uniref:Uncharacterized protein n=1 Tax=Physcomitrium patens TaxID=3218 RepID=A0A2K1J1L1_PHYPA|nr:hypothetical protein PHYPA_023314 [Physcomitrium patens]
MEELEVGLPKLVVVYYTKNLLKEYEIIKQMILNDKKLKTYLELEARLFIEENTRKVRADTEHDDKALLKSRHNFRTIPPHYHGGRSNSTGRSNFGHNGGYNNYQGHHSYTMGGPNSHSGGSYSSLGGTHSSPGRPYGGSGSSYNTHRNERYNNERTMGDIKSKNRNPRR